MSEEKNKHKERLQKQSEQQATGLVENKRHKEGYTDHVSIDPAQKIQQNDDSKVQNPDRNLAQGGNNMPYKKK
ncbi:hypothetical protein FVR03_16515 [Pontibacter qinzhouensis]|uniref:Uncharacterized protein n=1 Tax=Pontibacter qinzhouensis TaxID=2603253 RepID=A0A5C8JEM5_9BACT|nr:hypothetical protein [Pontibacter qinzhouensis]TXK36895.1 hypothetical protein FVR03_16515 [Pontibacter qinzhouensis]